MDRTIYAIDTCNQTTENFFTCEFPGSTWDEEHMSIIKPDGRIFDAFKMEVVGADFRDMAFWVLKEVVAINGIPVK